MASLGPFEWQKWQKIAQKWPKMAQEDSLSAPSKALPPPRFSIGSSCLIGTRFQGHSGPFRWGGALPGALGPPSSPQEKAGNGLRILVPIKHELPMENLGGGLKRALKGPVMRLFMRPFKGPVKALLSALKVPLKGLIRLFQGP